MSRTQRSVSAPQFGCRPAVCSGLAMLAMSLLTPLAAPATDGVKLLSQPGTFPITITQPGSYRLRKNIVVSNPNDTAIQVNANDVTIDLNGFSIIGPVVCTGDPVSSCAPSGSGVGISSSHENVTVTNGSIRGMGSLAVQLNELATVDGLRISGNGAGITIESGAVVNCSVSLNGGGIAIDGFGIARNNNVHGSAFGVVAGGLGIITGNNAFNNAGDGVDGDGALAAGNVGIGNDGRGVLGYLATGNVANQNTGVGIVGGELAVSNVAVDNTGLGLSVLPRTNLVSNVANGNNGGDSFPQVGGGLYPAAASNVCGSNATCP